MVVTRILPPTSKLGKRVKVTANGNSYTLDWNYNNCNMEIDAVNLFLARFGYTSIGMITTVKTSRTGTEYVVHDYAEREILDVKHSMQFHGETSVRVKFMSDKAESKWLTLTDAQLDRLINNL